MQFASKTGGARARKLPAAPGMVRTRPRLTALLAEVAIAQLPSRAAFPAGSPLPAEASSRFRVAPDSVADQQRIVKVMLNGVSCGEQVVQVSGAGTVITLPPAVVEALRLNTGGAALRLGSDPRIKSKYDEFSGTLSLTVPVEMLRPQRLTPDTLAPSPLSPETWGLLINYDLNLRDNFADSHQRARSGGAQWGGAADLNLLAPDVIGQSGWAFDSARIESEAVVRLDSSLTWRPADLQLAGSAGDALSVTTPWLGQARSYRFGGLQFGSDFGGTPGWSSVVVPSVTGTAQAQSTIDIYLNGQRTYRTNTSGGEFSVVLPSGATGSGATVVVTDVTGRTVLLPVEVPLADAQLLRQGLLLWSGGVGGPRFGYGDPHSTYARKLYGYADARYGAFDRATLMLHAEGGAGLAEMEAGADIAVASRIALHASFAASRAAGRRGGAAHLGITIAGPWALNFQAATSRTFGQFDDVVSVSGRDFARRHHADPELSEPASSELAARLSWQPSNRFSLAASYQSNRYSESAPVGFVALTANYQPMQGVPTFLNISRALGGARETTILAGVSFSFGAARAAVSGGWNSGATGLGAGSSGGATSTFNASQNLGDNVGDIGWNAFAARSAAANFASASAELRTSYGIPGVVVQNNGDVTTGYATLRGSAGIVGMHPFVADPMTSGIIIADVGQSGIPVQVNGDERGPTSWIDGKMATPSAVPGVPQRVTIDTDRLSMEAVATETEQVLVLRNSGASVASFGVRSVSSSALVSVLVNGAAPPVGSTLSSASSSAPVSKEGRAYLPSLAPNEVLRLEMPDGRTCRVATQFDGAGGVGRKLGPFRCEELH